MLSESSSKKIKGQTSDIIYKIGRYIKKKQIDKRTIDEFFYVDRKGTGLLSEKDIDNAFRNAGVKLRSTDFTELMNSMDQKGNGTYDYVQLLVALFGNTPDIKRKTDKLKRSDDRGEDTKRQLNYNNEDRRLRESKESNRSDRKRKSSRSRDGSRKGSVSSRGDSPRSRGRDDTRSRERTHSVKSGDSDNSRGSPNARSKSRKRDEEEEYDRSRSRDDRRDRAVTRTEDKDEKPLKSSLKNKEVDSITRFVGTQIRALKSDYISVFDEICANENNLMNDKQLMEALKKIGIELKYGDRERLSLEIDTQKIRNDDNTFNYRDFFIKANVMVGEPQRRNRSKETGGLTQTEIREALDTIKEIREELTYRKKDLHEVFNIKKDDHDIDFKEIRFGLQDHLDSVGDRIANSKRKMTSLKNYL